MPLTTANGEMVQWRTLTEDHRLHGSASYVNGYWLCQWEMDLSTPYKINIHQPITKKFGTGDSNPYQI